MKILTYISILFLSTIAVGQNPNSQKNDEFRMLFDRVQIDKGEEQHFFDSAVKLYEQGFLKQAGQIFDRIYRLDSSSFLGKHSKSLLMKIEETVLKQTQYNLNNSWNWNWSGTNWGPTDLPSKSNITKRIQLDGTSIKFYRNDTLTRETKYTLTQTLDWFWVFLTNRIQYEDTKEEWFFQLTSLYDFTSDRIWIEKKSNSVCGNYGECYLLDKEKQQLTGRFDASLVTFELKNH